MPSGLVYVLSLCYDVGPFLNFWRVLAFETKRDSSIVSKLNTKYPQAIVLEEHVTMLLEYNLEINRELTNTIQGVEG